MFDEAAFRERIPKLNAWVERSVISAFDASQQYMDYLGRNPALVSETYALLSESIQVRLSTVANAADRNWYLSYFSIPGQCVLDVKVTGAKVTLVKRIDGERREIAIERDHPVRVSLRALRQHLGMGSHANPA